MVLSHLYCLKMCLETLLNSVIQSASHLALMINLQFNLHQQYILTSIFTLHFISNSVQRAKQERVIIYIVPSKNSENFTDVNFLSIFIIFKYESGGEGLRQILIQAMKYLETCFSKEIMVLHLGNLCQVFHFIEIYSCIFCKKFVSLWTLLILVSLNVSVSQNKSILHRKQHQITYFQLTLVKKLRQ